MNNLRAGLLQRYRKRLYDPINLEPPLAKKVCPKRGGEDPTVEAPLPATTHPNEAGFSAAASTRPDATRSVTATTVQVDALGPNSAAAAQPDTTALGDAPTAVETRGAEGVSEAAIDEEAPDEKSSAADAVPPSWEEMMEMLKGVPCFTNAEASSTRMSDFFPLTKRVSVNMGGDPLAFVKAQLPFGTPEYSMSCIQHLQEWTIPETAEVVITSLLFFSSPL